MTDQTASDLREEVRARYAEAARAVLNPRGRVGCGAAAARPAARPDRRPGRPRRAHQGAVTPPRAAAGSTAPGRPHWTTADCFGGSLYGEGETDGLPEEAVQASLGCGNPLAVADLREGERVLDLGSGGGIDVLLSARRVGPSGFAYGVDMTDDMLTLARKNAAKAGASNVEFRKGEIEALPLPDASVDVVISNCVINLSTDKPAVLAEMFRVLVPGGRIGISDVVAEDHLSPADRTAAGPYAGCIAGALSRSEYQDGLAAAGFADASVTFTDEAAPGMHSGDHPGGQARHRMTAAGGNLVRRGYPGWRMVWALAVTETISYGVLYYSFAAFLLPMQHALGSSQTTLTGAFSVSVLVTGAAAVPAGAWLDCCGARGLMTAGVAARRRVRAGVGPGRLTCSACTWPSPGSGWPARRCCTSRRSPPSTPGSTPSGARRC